MNGLFKMLALSVFLNGCIFAAIPAQAGSPQAESPVRIIVDEFYGPLRGWRDVRKEFGAIGDGLKDDTAALQAAIDAVRAPSASPVLYIPAGVYRLTSTLNVERSGHSDSKDIIIIGEDPERTVLQWDGPEKGTMIRFGAWWSRLGRLTLDGSQRAKTAIAHGDLFSSINEISDLIIKDVERGIEAGSMSGEAAAETSVLRCRFLRCKEAGISVQNWNSLDWFVWDSQFEDCGYGVANVFGAGNFHVYRSLFNRSTESDLAIGNTGYFSIRDCISFDSKQFFKATATGAPALLTLQGNLVSGAHHTPVTIGNTGPLLLLDNKFKGVTNGVSVKMEKGSAGVAELGNQYSTRSGVIGSSNILSYRSGSASETATADYTWISTTPPRMVARIIEVLPGSSGTTIQEAIDSIEGTDEHPVVIHLPAAIYFVDQPIRLSGKERVRIVGDGGKTILKWTGLGSGPVVQISGPGKALVRDLRIHGGEKATGIRLDGWDEGDARIFFDQVDVRHQRQAGLSVAEMKLTDLEAASFYHAYCAVGVSVNGPVDDSKTACVSILGGASSNNELCYEVTGGGRLLVQDSWYESSLETCSKFMRCSGKGEFTLHGANIAPRYAPDDGATVLVDGFSGRLCFLNTRFAFENKLVMTERSTEAGVLLMGCAAMSPAQLPTSQARVASLKSVRCTPSGGAVVEPDRGGDNGHFVSEMLQLTRRTRQPLAPFDASQTSEVRLHRVFIEHGETGILVVP